MHRPLKHALPLPIQRPHIPTPNPVLPIVNLKRRVRVAIRRGRHPSRQTPQRGAQDAVREVVAGRVLRVDLDRGAAGYEVLVAVLEEAVAGVVDVFGDEGCDVFEGGGVLVGLVGG